MSVCIVIFKANWLPKNTPIHLKTCRLLCKRPAGHEARFFNGFRASEFFEVRMNNRPSKKLITKVLFFIVVFQTLCRPEEKGVLMLGLSNFKSAAIFAANSPKSKPKRQNI
jgi:hypothetical protein